MSKEIVEYDKYNNIMHRCRDFPDLAEEHNLDNSSELFREEMFARILSSDEIYSHDYESSLEFIQNLQIPQGQEVKLVKQPGCRLCHSDIIEDKIHYALLKGRCDIKTVQYYLFSKGIFFKEWFIKDHLKHINIYYREDVEVYKNKNSLDVINEEITEIKKEIEEAKKLGSTNYRRLSALRNQLKEYINAKSYYELGNEETNNNAITLDELKKKLNFK
ncbi:MAG: hypothetical protein ACOCP4_02975 [Candidatus Woesearchaeota archaeon]